MIEKHIDTPVLRIAYRQYGDDAGWPCVMGHGFPYDVHAYADVGPMLAAKGARVIVPYLRGYGPTSFVSTTTPRSGEQAALAADMLALMDALKIERAVLGGYDWGGRAACIIAALWPERVEALITGNSYTIQNIAKSWQPLPADQEATLWYQYYFHGERGRNGLLANRRDITRTLWRMWSPKWPFDEATFERSAQAFDNPDFVEVVLHSYRHRFGLVPGDPAYAHIETRLTAQPPITVPTVAVDGTADGVNPGTAHHARKFTGQFEYRTFTDAGHNLPQERPAEWVDAVERARELGRTR